MNKVKPIVFIICSGLGHINRGYESFSDDFFSHFSDNDHFQLYLLKGGGSTAGKEIKISCVKRNSATASLLSSLFKKDIYWIEQFTFFIGMLPYLIKYKTQVIYYNDVKLGRFLFHARRLFKFKYKLLFCNGSPIGPPYDVQDHIHQLLPLYITRAKAAGTPDHKMTLLALAFNINMKESTARVNDAKLWREKLQLPLDKKIIISVGALNTHHKRMDYLVKEFSNMDQDNYFLIILGQQDKRSSAIIKLAEDTLDKNSYLFKQVTTYEVPFYLAASDYFILASLFEGLPRALPEAIMNGLTPIVHNYDVTRETVGSWGVFKDMREENVLQNAINEVNIKNNSKNDIIAFAWENYSWENLKKSYEDMIVTLCE